MQGFGSVCMVGSGHIHNSKLGRLYSESFSIRVSYLLPSYVSLINIVMIFVCYLILT